MSLKNLPVVFKKIASCWKTILKMIMAAVLFVTAETVLIVGLKQTGFFESHQQLNPVRIVPIPVASISLDDSSLARSYCLSSSQSGLRNRSCRSTALHTDRSMTQAYWELTTFSGVTAKRLRLP
jgi:hypothetical protein